MCDQTWFQQCVIYCYNDELILRSVAAEAVIRSSWAAQSLNDLWALAGGGRSCSSRGGRTQGKALGARPIIIVLLPPCHLHQQHHHVCHFQLHRVSAGESGGRLRELVEEESGVFWWDFCWRKLLASVSMDEESVSEMASNKLTVSLPPMIFLH